MCGILGVVGPPVRAGDLPSFHHALGLLQHRGPDNSGVWHDQWALLGHTRLSIIDLSDEANQPLHDAAGRFHIVYNGEIYNYQDIRTQLLDAGARVRSDSDTEVVLEAYKCWGPAALQRFNGMFAFVIYDEVTRRIFAARDRFGVKPLYYSERDGCFRFASEMKALLALGSSRQPNWRQVSQYLQGWGCDASDETVFAGISALPAGHFLEFDGGRLRVVQWWDIAERRVDVPKRYDERVSAFRELLSDAVRLRLRNDVETGVCLSGGMDSSAVYGFARELHRLGKVRFATSAAPKSFRVFSISYPGTAVDEYPWAEQCVRAWNDNSRVSVVQPTPERFPELIDDVIWHQEAPVWSSSVLAFHILYEHIASEQTRVVLEGHGGDELLGGYPYMVQAAVESFAAAGRWRWAWQAARCLAQTQNPAIDERGFPAWKVFLRAFPRSRAALRWLDWQVNRFRRGGREQPALCSYVSPDIAQACPPTTPAPVDGMSSLGATLSAAFTERILPIVLRVVDRATMTYGIESRAPLLDYRLVQFAFSLPDEDRIARQTKRILRSAAAKVVPRGVIRRRAKMGFAIAERDWFDSPVVSDYLRDVCGSAEVRQADFLDGAALQADVERCARDGFTWLDTTRIWEALNIFLWHKRFVRNTLVPDRPPVEEAACLTPA
ncbi:MAG: asparagine synthase (glutamine-hydrolyzing) [Planctomycetes bacterium]|nr:asparagine synthase (glutamine-hydrolyzing) [Planctomycetota bacterium]